MGTSWTTRTSPSTSWTERENPGVARITEAGEVRMTEGSVNRILEKLNDWTSRTGVSTSWTTRTEP